MIMSDHTRAVVNRVIRQVISRSHDGSLVSEWAQLWADPIVPKELGGLDHDELKRLLARRFKAEMERQVRSLLGLGHNRSPAGDRAIAVGIWPPRDDQELDAAQRGASK
jgi:hypothetical protein